MSGLGDKESVGEGGYCHVGVVEGGGVPRNGHERRESLKVRGRDGEF